MNQYRYIIVLLLLFLAFSGNAQTRKEDQIDEEYHKCLMNDTSYAVLADCSFKAFEQWDKELNKAYGKLLEKIKKEKDREAMKESQAAWIAYKDAEFKAYNFVFNLPGNEMSIMREEGRIEVVRERTLQLRAYIEALKIEKEK
jgi:uncharacterized protein YecT (DUF1311 family)